MIIIAAMTEDRVIGKENRLLWNIPEDLKNFKRLTTGNTVIMGRKTFESIGKPLPGRNNIVLTRRLGKIEGVDVAGSVRDAIRKAEEYGKEIYIIGGQKVYEQFIETADRIILSVVDGKYEGDSFFPDFSEDEWKLISEEQKEGFKIKEYSRKPPKNRDHS